MPFDSIVIRGAQEHNLKRVDLDLPRHRLTVLTGVSGSGKSSLAFDTVFKEGQRRYLESLSAYARQFLGQMEKPRVEHIAGLSPTVAVDQKTTNRNPRSTVGTITEVYDYLRVLFARIGVPHCPKCGEEIERQSPEQIVDRILSLPEGTRFSILAPVVRGRKGEYREDLANLRAAGYARARIDGEIRSLDEPIELSRYKRHTIEVVVDRLSVSREPDDRSRLTDSVETALELGKGLVVVLLDRRGKAALTPALSQRARADAAERPPPREAEERREGSAGQRRGRQAKPAEREEPDESEWLLSRHGGCPKCGVSLPELEPRLFSFNSTFGACPKCNGLGKLLEIDPDLVVSDKTKSIRQGALASTLQSGYILYSRLGPDGWEQMARHFGFSLDTPWQDLAPEHQKLILHGSGRARFRHHWRWQSADGKHQAEGTTSQRFQGIIPIMRSAYEHNRAEHVERFMSSQPCAVCQGRRLRPEALAVTFHGKTIDQLASSSVGELLGFFEGLSLGEREAAIAGQLLREIRARLGFLRDVGLSYLTLDRAANTLAGGEAQRLRLAAQLGAGLEGVLYVLDEPSIGLHHRDNQKLLDTLERLRDRDNTVLVVEHDEETIRRADWVVDFGPGAGRLGGEVVTTGPPDEVAQADGSLTARYLRHELEIPIPGRRRRGNGHCLRVVGAREHNLKGITVDIPLGAFVCVTGVSGSGKSTLVDDVLKKALARRLHGAQEPPGRHDRIEGIEHVDKVIEIDQSPIGRTPRSNPATYTGVFDHIRSLFADLPESRVRGYKPGRFSFNVKGGRCEACGGGGTKVIEMQFLADVEVPCEVCGGRRFNNETLRVKYKGKDIHDVLAMTVAEAREFFDAIPAAARILQTLVDVGLGYVTLGQSSTTLSGGEAQRIKLAEQLARPATGRTLFVLDEPTTGLHFADVQRLLDVLQRLVDAGNTVLVVEHNPDVVKVADHVIDLGPEGGADGGWVVAQGTPEEVAQVLDSHTGRMLAEVLGQVNPRSILPGRGEGETGNEAALPGPDGRPRRDGSRTSPCSGETDRESSVGIDVRYAPEEWRSLAHFAGNGDASGRRESDRGADGSVAAGEARGRQLCVAEASARYSSADAGRADGRAAVEAVEAIADGDERLPSVAEASPRRRVIAVRGARKHNLKGIDVDVPKNKLTVVTGVSGSGKSSLAMDTIFTEGQRRFVECLSSYARQFLGRLDDAAVERIDGLSPAIAIDQKYGVRSPRSTVATATELYDYLRLLYARLGRPYCPQCQEPLVGLTSSEIVQRICELGTGTRAYLLAPVERGLVGDVAEVLRQLRRDGYSRALVDGHEVSLDAYGDAATQAAHSQSQADVAASEKPPTRRASDRVAFDPRRKHDVDVVIDRLVVDPSDVGRLADSVELGLARGKGSVTLQVVGSAGQPATCRAFTRRPSCARCGTVLEEELTPRLFSPNYHAGACPECKGLGVIRSLAPELVVPNPDLSYLEGAIALIPASEIAGHRFTHVVRSVASHYGFDLSRPWRDLAPEHRRLILYGTEGEKLTISREHRGKRSEWTWTREGEWRGIIPHFMQWYRRTRDAKWAQWLESFMSEVTCPSCDGEKLKPLYRAVRLGGKTIGEVGRMSVDQAREFFARLELDEHAAAVAAQALKEVNDRLQFLADVGLGYLTLDRQTATLSGGEAQRIRLATQVGTKLVDALYVLDEPSIGLHQRDVQRLLRTLQALRDLGNTVIVVEHDEEVIRAADHVIDVGPGPGSQGGWVVAEGSVEDIQSSPASLTGAYLRGRLRAGQIRRPTSVPDPLSPSPEESAAGQMIPSEGDDAAFAALASTANRPGVEPHPASLVIRGAREHNLKDIDVAIPLARLVAVTGVSGSGKSTLVADILEKALSRRLHWAQVTPGAHRGLEGVEHVDRVVAIDQHPIGRSTKSNPATYTGVFDFVRALYAELPEAKARGYTKSRFSFNDPKGWCSRCQGEGVNRISMHFLADVEVVCEACGGKRYNAETLAVRYRGKSVADVLEMRIADAVEFFAPVVQIRQPLQVLCDVGLGYMALGQSSNSLSGGEAQRVKLAAELCRSSLGRTLYILDEPTVGLHFADVSRLLTVLRRLVDAGHTVVVVEHNLDVVAAADHVIDLGPEGGDLGGYLVATGAPEEIALVPTSHTGRFLRAGLAIDLSRH